MTVPAIAQQPSVLDAEGVTLQPPLDKIVRSGLAKLRVSRFYYDEPVFDEYESTTVRSTWDLAGVEDAVEDGDSVLDLGCGDGRLLLHLADCRQLADSVGLDVSEVAIGRFNRLIPDAYEGVIEARVGNALELTPDVAKRKFDVVILGDATVNYFVEDQHLDALLATASAQLRDASSRVVISGFADGTPEKLAFLDKRCTVTPFQRPSGQAVMIWWAYKFDPDKLVMHRSAYAQLGWDGDGLIEGVVCDLRDRMWTPSSIEPIANHNGLRVDRVMNSSVQDGAATGMGTAVTVLRPA